MSERAEQSTLAIHVQVTCGPNRGRADVAGKDRAVGSHFIQQLRDILRMNRLTSRFADGKFIQSATSFRVVLQARIQEAPLTLLLQERSEGLQGPFHAADNSQVDSR